MAKPLRPKKEESVTPARIQSDFPKHSLEEALRVPNALEAANGGQPLPPVELAIAMNISPGSSGLRSILSSSFKYGLTAGSYKSDRVSLDEMGRNIVEPTNESVRLRALVTAALTPPTFRSIFDYFRGKKLPEAVYFQNTVFREFGVPREHAELCVKIFWANMEYAGLLRNAATGKWLSTDSNSTPVAETQPNESIDDSSADEVPPPARDSATRVPPAGPTGERLGQAIFLGHGKNRKPLDQLKQILEEYKIPFKIAVDEPNKFRPISQKVSETMHGCGAAILIFTADEEFKDLDGNTIWRPSENVIYELGAASVLYGKKIIIFKEDSVHFPSNFQDIGYINFEKDALSAKAIDLFRELISFGLIKVSVPV